MSISIAAMTKKKKKKKVEKFACDVQRQSFGHSMRTNGLAAVRLDGRTRLKT